MLVVKKRKQTIFFFTTAGTDTFKEIANAWLEESIDVEHTDL